MFLSNTAKYGIIAIVDIAINSYMNTHVKISDLSARTNISLKYLEVILLRLKNANILRSITGPNGGYILAKEKNKITIRDVIFAADKKIKITRCDEDGNSCLKISSKCVMHHFFYDMQNFLSEEFENITIESMITRYKSTGKTSMFFNKNLDKEIKKTKENEYIYADYNSTFPMRDEFKKIISYSNNSNQYIFFNPSSIHRAGQRARKFVEDSRFNIRTSLGDKNNEYDIIFTSTATEAHNLLINSFQHTRILISSIEHVSIYKISKNMNIIKVHTDGIIDLSHLQELCSYNNDKNNQFLCSVVFANNETGIIQPIKEVADIVHQYGGILHVDAVQMYGRNSMNIKDLDIDIMTISGHKVGAGFGTACLIYRHKSNIKIQAFIHGGGQEKGIRCGTENVASIYCLGEFAKNIDYYIQEWRNVEKLRNIFEEKIMEISKDIIICSSKKERLPNTSCIITPKLENDIVIMFFDMHNVYVSKGSACSSGTADTSHVLLNMGYPELLAKCAIRISFGPRNTKEEVLYIANLWEKLYNESALS